MSCDFAIWYTDRVLTDREAQTIYEQLCEGKTELLASHPSIEAFYTELTSRHPEIDDVLEEDIDNIDLCPWSIAFDKSPRHLIICCVWSKAEYVQALLRELAAKHSLAVFDPQLMKLYLPRGE